jgi:hypothetical protein
MGFMAFQFPESAGRLVGDRVWFYDDVSDRRLRDVAAATMAALDRPDDFPPLARAIVPGDRVVLAIDPNVPDIAAVVRGVVTAISHTDAAGIDVVLWDEATDETVEAIRGEVAPQSRVVRHASADRRQLSYLAADEAADPIYLNRLLVDADFVLPIMAARFTDLQHPADRTGVYPWLADSAARARHRDGAADDAASRAKMATETTWLLGVQVMVCVSPSIDGGVSEVMAGTIEAMEKRWTRERRSDAETGEVDDAFPPPAGLVIACLDGDRQQQTWANAARAAMAATRRVTPGGTIVLWTDIDQAPLETSLAGGADDPYGADFDGDEEDDVNAESTAKHATANSDADEFPAWDPATGIWRTLAGVAEEYHVMVHSRLDDTVIEQTGLGAIGDATGLGRLCESFDGVGVMRAAQFA